MTSCPIPRPRGEVRSLHLLVREPHRHPKEFVITEFEIDILSTGELVSPQLKRELIEFLVERDQRARDPEDYTLEEADTSTPGAPVLELRYEKVFQP